MCTLHFSANLCDIEGNCLYSFKAYSDFIIIIIDLELKSVFFLSIEGCISTPHLWGAQDLVVLSCKESFLKNLFGFRILFYIKN